MVSGRWCNNIKEDVVSSFVIAAHRANWLVIRFSALRIIAAAPVKESPSTIGLSPSQIIPDA